MLKKYIFIISLLFIVSSCVNGNFPDERADVKSLLTSSSERVAFSLTQPGSYDVVKGWISEDAPAFVELSCRSTSPFCMKLENILDTMKINYENIEDEQAMNSVVLIYDRTVVKDCDNKTTGCSVSANIIQSVKDYDQFMKPSLLDYPDASEAVSSIRSKK